MKMKRTFDDETAEVTYSIPGFAFVANIAHSPTSLGGSVVQLQDVGGAVMVKHTRADAAEHLARQKLFEFYKDNVAA